MTRGTGNGNHNGRRGVEGVGAQSSEFPTFAAIDFETADNGRDSACAVAVIKVAGQRVVHRESRLIRPPRREFLYTYIHGITWEDVAEEPDFSEVWPSLSGLLDDVDFIAAHNASFDRGVLQACCESAGLDVPESRFLCTVSLARRVWNIYPTKLPNVCERLNLPLNHHDPLSDAEACARIVIEALKHGADMDVLQCAMGLEWR